jgi:hypothetical protein
MKSLSRVFVFVGLLAVVGVLAAQPAIEQPVQRQPAPIQPAVQPVQPVQPAVVTTHDMTADVKVMSADGKTRLQTLGIDGQGRVLALVAPPRTFGAPMENGFGEVHVFSPEGKPIKQWRVDFHAHSVAAGPDGTIYVAGDGRVARFDKDGRALGSPVELPHIAELFQDKAAMRKKAEEQIKKQQESMKVSIENSRKRVQEMIAKIEAKKAEDRTPTEVKQLEQYKNILKSYDNMVVNPAAQNVDAIINQMTGRARIINGIAISKADIFVVCGDIPGYGYAVWRFDHNMKNAKKVMGELSGCCGQMDIQVQGTDLLVAENTKHSWARYDRDGAPLGRHGKKMVPGKVEPDCFGGCCNPMNLRAIATGDIFTAESEGIVKRFSAKGDFLDTAAVFKLTGGCKNVAVAASADGKLLYICDQPGTRFVIMTKKTAAR